MRDPRVAVRSPASGNIKAHHGFLSHCHDLACIQRWIWNFQSCSVRNGSVLCETRLTALRHDYTILKAFNPYYGFDYLARNKYEGWRSLGGILLAFTGVEALFADIGAFSRRAVQISWLGYAYPCLLLAYSGQAAFISENPDAYSNPFYNCVPKGWLYPSLVIAILAAIVASQAMITATFQVSRICQDLSNRANILSFLPKS